MTYIRKQIEKEIEPTVNELKNRFREIRSIRARYLNTIQKYLYYY